MSKKSLYDLTLNISANSAELTKGIKEANNKISSLQSNSANVGKQVVGAFTKMAVGAFSVTAAFELVKKTMTSTEGSADSLDKMMGTLEGTTSGLFRTLATGDWNNLITNIKNTAEATRDLRVAMDELEDLSASNRLKKSILNTSLQDTRLQIAGTTDPTKKAELISNAISIQQSITGVEVSEQKKRIDNTYNFYEKLLGQDEEYFAYLRTEIPKLAGNWEYFGSEAFKAGLEARKGTLEYTKSLGKLSVAQAEELHNLKLTLFALEDYIKIKDDLSKPGQFNEFVGELATLNDIIALGKQDLIKLEKSLTTTEGKIERIIRLSSPTNFGLSNLKGPSITDMLHGGKGLKLQGLQDSNISVPDQLTTSLGIAQNAVLSLENSFETLFLNVGGGFKGMIRSLMDSVNMLLAQLVAKAAIFGILQLLFPGSGAAVGALTNLRKFIGIPGYANGTNFAPGGWSIVGERGPELVNLPRGSSVYSNSASNNMMGGVSETRIEGTDIIIVTNKLNKINLAY